MPIFQYDISIRVSLRCIVWELSEGGVTVLQEEFQIGGIEQEARKLSKSLDKLVLSFSDILRTSLDGGCKASCRERDEQEIEFQRSIISEGEYAPFTIIFYYNAGTFYMDLMHKAKRI